MIRFSNGIMETPHFYGDSKYPIGDSAASLYNWMAVIREMCELAVALPSMGAGVTERSCSEAIHMAIKPARGGGLPANRGRGNLDFPAGFLRAPLTVFRQRSLSVGQV